MSIHFHPLTIREVRKETPDCVSIAFDIPAHLRNNFKFKQGQNLTLRTRLNGEEVRRTYSLCSSPLDNEWRVAVKKVEGGLFSSFANEQLKKGDLLEVMEPVGSFFTELDPANRKSYLAIAAGSGITPVISLIKTTLLTEPRSRFTLVYGNRNRASVIFFEELEALKNRFMDRFDMIHILSREKTEIPLNGGRIGPEKMEELGRLISFKTIDEFFICGPEELIFSVRDYLGEKGIEKKKIHFELFSSPGQVMKSASLKKQETTAGPQSRITIKLDGRSFEFNLARGSGISILDAALQEGADLPFACKGGMCCTCKARLLEGEVKMDVHWGLEDEEVEKGYILTCQSHPVTGKVVVDFDIK